MIAAVVLVAALGVSDPAPQDEKFQKEVAAAREKAVKLLLSKQKPDGSWEEVNVVTLDMEGGQTALVALALLEAGVPADHAAVEKVAAYLAKLPPKKTYVVSLQTQVLARMDAKKYATQIQANAGWLAGSVVRKGGEFRGWSYPAEGNAADGSNTHFAVVGLHAAVRAGAKVDPKLWDEIREMYARTQTKDGWAYMSMVPAGGRATTSMTASALVGLALAAKHDAAKVAAPGEAFDKGLKAFLAGGQEKSKSEGYMWLVTAELGRALGGETFKAGEREVEWYKDGAAKLLKEQKPSGAWSLGESLDKNELYTTACGLFFLGPPQK